MLHGNYDSSTITSCNLTTMLLKCVITICFEIGENAGEMLEKWLDLLVTLVGKNQCVITICFEIGENAGEMLEKMCDLLSSMRKCRCR